MAEKRVIRYGDKKIEMPEGMTLEQAKAQMARFFAELAEPEVTTKKEGDTTVYVFSKKAGKKGGSYEKCRRCGEYGWAGSHKCAAEWLFAEYIDEPDWQPVYADDAETAAEKAAAKVWTFESGDSIEIWLRKPGEKTAARWDVSVEPVPSFNASDALLPGRKHETREVTEADDIEPAEEPEKTG